VFTIWWHLANEWFAQSKNNYSPGGWLIQRKHWPILRRNVHLWVLFTNGIKLSDTVGVVFGPSVRPLSMLFLHDRFRWSLVSYYLVRSCQANLIPFRIDLLQVFCRVFRMEREWNFIEFIKNDLSYIKLVQSSEYLTKHKEISVCALRCLVRGFRLWRC
jgi:hypothetical protein